MTLSLRSVVLLWLTCLASAAAVSVVVNRPPAEPSSAPAPLADDLVVRRFAERLDALERRMDGLDLRPYDAPVARPLTTHAPDGGALPSPADLEGRLARLEAFEAERLRDRLAVEEAQARAAEINLEREQREGQRLAALILDPARGDREKTEAWMRMGRLQGSPWRDDVVLEMARIGEASEDDRAREEVWIGADHGRHRNELLVGPLLRALTSDAVANVREEAADALGHYLHLPDVRQALATAAAADSSGKVRQQAERVLGERGG